MNTELNNQEENKEAKQEFFKPFKLDAEYVAYKMFDKLFTEGCINMETYEKIQKEFNKKYGEQEDDI